MATDLLKIYTTKKIDKISLSVLAVYSEETSYCQNIKRIFINISKVFEEFENKNKILLS